MDFGNRLPLSSVALFALCNINCATTNKTLAPDYLDDADAASLVTDQVKADVDKIQENAARSNVSLESVIRAIYAIVTPDTNIAEMMDPSLVRTVNPCRDDQVNAKNHIASVLENNPPWEAKRILLESLLKNPEFLRSFKRTAIYSQILASNSDYQCREPEVSFFLDEDSKKYGPKLHVELNFCGESSQKIDISRVRFLNHLDWYLNPANGTCNDKVKVFPDNEDNFFEVQDHSGGVYSVVGPKGIVVTGDLASILIPEMQRQSQNIANSSKAQLDLNFYKRVYVSPRINNSIGKEKKTVNAQIDHLLFVFKKHFGSNILMEDYGDQSLRIIMGDKVIKIDVRLVENADAPYFTYTPHILDCSRGANCKEKDNVNFNVYSQSSQDFLTLTELTWWLDTNHVYSYLKRRD